MYFFLIKSADLKKLIFYISVWNYRVVSAETKPMWLKGHCHISHLIISSPSTDISSLWYTIKHFSILCKNLTAFYQDSVLFLWMRNNLELIFMQIKEKFYHDPRFLPHYRDRLPRDEETKSFCFLFSNVSERLQTKLKPWKKHKKNC